LISLIDFAKERESPNTLVKYRVSKCVCGLICVYVFCVPSVAGELVLNLNLVIIEVYKGGKRFIFV